jgi:hypothetical protein
MRLYFACGPDDGRAKFSQNFHLAFEYNLQQQPAEVAE